MYFAVVCSLCIISSLFVGEISSNQIYKIIHEKAELAFYQKGVTEDVSFIVNKVNSSHISLSTKFTMTQDFLDRKIMLKISVDKLYASEYKPTGTSVTGNICKAWEKNIFGMRDIISKYGYFDPCEVKKGVSYYLKNYIVDTSNYPKILPYGSYRVIMDCFYQNETYKLPLILLHWYARVEKVLKF